jgi:hypothetical protein
MKSPEKYAEPLALEIQNKSIGSRRRVAADFWGDGTGALFRVASVDETALAASDYITVTVRENDTDQGGVGYAEPGDLLTQLQADGSARAIGGGSTPAAFYAWEVTDRSRKNKTVTLKPVTATGATVTDVSASNLAAGDQFVRVGQPDAADLTSITDYGSETQVMAGIEALTKADGSTVHDLTMSGALGGTRYDAGGVAIDVEHIQAAMDEVKVNVGEGAYTWKKMHMAPETHAALINSRETDRRFFSVEDNKRGTRFFAYQHGNDTLECATSEWIPSKRIWILPEQKSGKKVLEFYGSDFEPVRIKNSDEFMLKPSGSGGHVNEVVSYLQGILLLICKHPKSIVGIHNFTNS